MNYISITTPENIELEYRLAGAGSRLLAIMIDLFIQALLYGLLYYLFYMIQGSFYFSGWNAFITMIAGFLISYGYFIIMEILLKGQTPGKKILKLRAISQNGQPLSVTQSFIRNIFRYFIDNYFVGIILILFTKQYKRLGDMAAGTIVVAEKLEQIPIDFQSIAIDTGGIELAQYPLDASETRLLKEFLTRRHLFIDKGAALEKKFIQYFSQKFALEPNQIPVDFLEAIARSNRI